MANFLLDNAVITGGSGMVGAKICFGKKLSSAELDITNTTSVNNYFEINNTFYKIPDENIWNNWYKNSNKNFKFIIKLNRIFTHIKKLSFDKQILKLFL